MRTLLKFSFLFFTFSLICCSPLQRVSRIVRNHPQLSITDTIKYSKLVIYPARMSVYNIPDSVLARMQPGDSIIAISKKGVTIIIRKKTQATEIEASVPADSIRVDTTFITSSVTVVKDDKTNRRLTRQKLRIVYIVSIILLIMVIYIVIRKIIGE